MTTQLARSQYFLTGGIVDAVTILQLPNRTTPVLYSASVRDGELEQHINMAGSILKRDVFKSEVSIHHRDFWEQAQALLTERHSKISSAQGERRLL